MGIPAPAMRCHSPEAPRAGVSPLRGARAWDRPRKRFPSPTALRRGLLALLAIVATGLLSGPARAADAPTAASADLEAAAGSERATGRDVWVGAVGRLRSFAGVVLLLTMVAAGIAYALGNQRLALLVMAGALVLYLGFWIVAVIAGPLRTTPLPPGQIDYQTESSGSGGTELTRVVKGVLHAGLQLLSVAAIPFLVVYGGFLGVSVAISGGLEPGTLSAFLVGSAVILLANSVAALLNAFA